MSALLCDLTPHLQHHTLQSSDTIVNCCLIVLVASVPVDITVAVVLQIPYQEESPRFIVKFSMIAVMVLYMKSFVLLMWRPYISRVLMDLRFIRLGIWDFIMDHVIGGKFKLGRKIGRGSFGELYLDVESDALATLILNKLRAGIKVCAIKAPGFGENRKTSLQHLATLTGGQVVSHIDQFLCNLLTRAEFTLPGVDVDEFQVNVHSGGVSLGHPLGCSCIKVIKDIASDMGEMIDIIELLPEHVGEIKNLVRSHFRMISDKIFHLLHQKVKILILHHI
ncbi:hypothetical protein L1987_06528 [Smallanthus sonchifolius]|uniref:Uncharacterized protein n=1 Tax=Smallanthus sonchifolius TaxID=185202 RepID=A0ACB9JYH0_9ASTR|nr:hypothetical protein L1987_06528 [Smallanthus sonchifolius]